MERENLLRILYFHSNLLAKWVGEKTRLQLGKGEMQKHILLERALAGESIKGLQFHQSLSRSATQ